MLLSWCVILFSFTTLGQTYLWQFPLHQKTKYFDFYYQRNTEKVAEIARFADAFIKIVNRDFIKVDFEYPIRTLVLQDRSTFQEFLRRELHVSDPPEFGIYIPSQKLFATYEDSGMDTFAHEIMHPLVERNLRERPMWALEGIPAFFEKFYGYWTNDDLVVHWGYQNPWRIKQLGTNLVQLDLKQLVSNPRQPRESDESSVRMVSMFLWDQGKFQRFLELVATQNKGHFNSYFEAAMEKPLEQIVPIWQQYLKRVEKKRGENMRLPASTIFRDEASFQKCSKTYNLLPVE